MRSALPHGQADAPALPPPAARAGPHAGPGPRQRASPLDSPSARAGLYAPRPFRLAERRWVCCSLACRQCGHSCGAQQPKSQHGPGPRQDSGANSPPSDGAETPSSYAARKKFGRNLAEKWLKNCWIIVEELSKNCWSAAGGEACVPARGSLARSALACGPGPRQRASPSGHPDRSRWPLRYALFPPSGNNMVLLFARRKCGERLTLSPPLASQALSAPRTCTHQCGTNARTAFAVRA